MKQKSDTGDDAQLVIFGYSEENPDAAIAALTFPDLGFEIFRSVYQDSCGWNYPLNYPLDMNYFQFLSIHYIQQLMRFVLGLMMLQLY